MKQVLILGGYGNLGSRIATALAKDNISIIISGRELQKAEALRNQLKQNASEGMVRIAAFDANKELGKQLDILKPTLVINTIGPFQTADYSIAKTCVQHKVHYIDLADARNFVSGITCLDALAKENKTLVITGASTVPGLSSAVLERYKNDFETMDSLIYGISPGQKAPRGLATTEAILTYLGKPLNAWGNSNQTYFGWQDLYRQEYPELGKRWMANGKPIELKWFIIAKDNDGPQIPCVPAIILSKKIIQGTLNKSGAMPCIGMVTLEEYMRELEGFSIKQYVNLC